MPPFDVPLTLNGVPAGSTNTSTVGSFTGSLIVVAVTAAPAATGAAKSATRTRLRSVRRLITRRMIAHAAVVGTMPHTIRTGSVPGAHPRR